MKWGWGKRDSAPGGMPGTGNGVVRGRESAPPSQQTLSEFTGRRAAKQTQPGPGERSTSWEAAQRKGCGPAGFSRQTAGVRKRPRRNQRINRCGKRGRSGSAAPRVRMRGRSSWPGSLFLSATSWAMVMVKPTMHRIEPVAGGAELDPGSASRSGRALILVVRRRESRARSRNNEPGRGWTLQFSGLETLEKARQRNQYHPA